MLVITKNKGYSLICICLFSLFSCKGEQADSSEDNVTKEIKKTEYIVIHRESTVSTYLVEGVDVEGLYFRGNVKIKGDTGAGYIAKDSLSPKVYIEVRRSQDGGLIGTDTNGKEYQLAFLNEE